MLKAEFKTPHNTKHPCQPAPPTPPRVQTRLQPEVQKLALDMEFIVSVPRAGPGDRDKAGHCSQPADLALAASCLQPLLPQDASAHLPRSDLDHSTGNSRTRDPASESTNGFLPQD